MDFKSVTCIKIFYLDGAGYVEDGREIFDDEMDDDSSASTSSKFIILKLYRFCVSKTLEH